MVVWLRRLIAVLAPRAGLIISSMSFTNARQSCQGYASAMAVADIPLLSLPCSSPCASLHRHRFVASSRGPGDRNAVCFRIGNLVS